MPSLLHAIRDGFAASSKLAGGFLASKLLLNRGLAIRSSQEQIPPLCLLEVVTLGQTLRSISN